MKQKPVPILITWDVDPDTYLVGEKGLCSIDLALDLCQELDIESTFFITANGAHGYARQLERMSDSGHEVGCHGLTHGREESYDQMPEAMQQAYIAEATQRLEALTGTSMHSFRSPRVRISGQTLRFLAERGYLADSSICPQRLDFVSANLINKGWLYAPRRSYHPHRDNAFKRGDLSIWEVPISAMVVPYISASLNVLGLTFMKVFFRLLYSESRRGGKPIVYLAHPLEFVSTRSRRIKRQYFSPSYIRYHGFLGRRLLYRMDGEAWLKCTRKLFAYMASFPDVTFVTVSQYTTHHLNASPLHDGEMPAV